RPRLRAAASFAYLGESVVLAVAAAATAVVVAPAVAVLGAQPRQREDAVDRDAVRLDAGAGRDDRQRRVRRSGEGQRRGAGVDRDLRRRGVGDQPRRLDLVLILVLVLVLDGDERERIAGAGLHDQLALLAGRERRQGHPARDGDLDRQALEGHDERRDAHEGSLDLDGARLRDRGEVLLEELVVPELDPELAHLP